MSADPAVKAYFAEAIAWDADRIAMKERSVRIAWRVATVSSFVTVLAIAAVLVLMPLKRVDPFLIRVDSSTGLVDVVPVFSGDTPLPETVTRYFLDHYVTICERFNFSTAESDYQECGAFHNPQRNQAWYAAWAKTNPNSPLNLYKDGTTVRAQVTSVSFFRRADGVDDLAQVRYVKAKRQSGTAEEEQTHWVATLRFAYSKPAAEAATRRWNPLGFKVLDFRPEPEVLSEAPAPGKHP
jgi:type IV secretion system protein VirB8